MSRCIAFTKSGKRGMGPRCKRNCADGSDFCKQHNPLTKMDDVTCAICLDDIKNPMKLNCVHVFCKDCISETVLHRNVKCPCCRGTMNPDIIHECLRVKVGKKMADKFKLDYDMAARKEKWTLHQWTASMRRSFFAVYPPEM